MAWNYASLQWTNGIFISHFTVHVIIYTCWDWSSSILVKGFLPGSESQFDRMHRWVLNNGHFFCEKRVWWLWYLPSSRLWNRNVATLTVNAHGSSIHHYSDVLMRAMASQITGVSMVCSIVYSGADQRNHESSASLAYVRETLVTGEFLSQRASNAENVVIWWSHHDPDYNDIL